MRFQKSKVAFGLLIVGVVVAFSGNSFAAVERQANLVINWQHVEQYSDVRAADSHQGKFEARTFKSLEKLLKTMAKQLPKGQSLSITVNDLDLAGMVLPGYSQGFDNPRDVRVIRSIDYPRMSFDYQLVDANGKVLRSAQVNLKDMQFQNRIRSAKFKRDSLGYEKNMLKNWFAREFKLKK